MGTCAIFCATAPLVQAGKLARSAVWQIFKKWHEKKVVQICATFAPFKNSARSTIPSIHNNSRHNTEYA